MAKATDFVDFWKTIHSDSNGNPGSTYPNLLHLYENRTAQAAFLEYAFMPEERRIAVAIHLAAGAIFQATQQRPPKGLITTFNQELYFTSQVASKCSLEDLLNLSGAVHPIGPARLLVSNRLTRWTIQRLLSWFFGASPELSSYACQSPERLTSFLIGVAIAGFFLAALSGEPDPTGNGSCASCTKG